MNYRELKKNLPGRDDYEKTAPVYPVWVAVKNMTSVLCQPCIRHLRYRSSFQTHPHILPPPILACSSFSDLDVIEVHDGPLSRSKHG
ncbi:hypothetical protein E2C01_029285 [Portunus trituberculatus]|uniref:Uncharacterized protein n=1 Tax=Portunus trituberculatus TaxID=210409 RepID=A0A5B7ERE7_PORTR|nr:hypothetical protein [Portunus trituberculatus]